MDTKATNAKIIHNTAKEVETGTIGLDLHVQLLAKRVRIYPYLKDCWPISYY